MKRFAAVILCIFFAVSFISAEVTSISLSRDHLSSTEKDRTVEVTVTGTGFDTLKSLHVQLSQNGKNQSPVQCEINEDGTQGKAVITVPSVQNVTASGVPFTVRAIENFTSVSSITAVIRITPPATITRLVISDFSEGDAELSLKLYGRNLDIRGETEIKLMDSDGNEAVECTTILPAPVQELEEEPEVKPQYEIGDLVLRDGSIVAVDDYNKRKMGIPVGVIAYERDGNPYMVGVAGIADANTGYGMRWCSYYAEGYDEVPELNAWTDNDYVDYADITGHTDGSEAWGIIQMLDPENTSDYEAEDMYPAFWYAENYGVENDLLGTKYETGWFIPSLWELAEVYRNSGIINDSFSEFCNYDMGYRRYRSSSQNPYDSNYSPGINFDEGYIWETYSSKDESDVYVMTVCSVFGEAGSSSGTLEVSVPVPEESGIFSVQVTIDGVLQTVAGRIQIAGAPEITRVEMPSVSKAFCGEEIPVVIYGKNFTVQDMSAEKFIVFGLEASPVRIISDTQASVNITYPDSEGTYEVTFVCDESIYTGTLSILGDVQGIWEPGDVILNNGKRVPVSEVSKMTAAQKANAVAVVAFTKYGLIPFGMGLEQNDGIWLMKEYSKGYNTVIQEIQCDRSGSWYADEDVMVTGDKTGFDNWSVLQALDPEGSRRASENYPGFDWAQNYGITYGLPASCSDGWFVPSLDELIQIYKNYRAVNASLRALGKTALMNGWYSTSSQDPDDSDYIWRVDFTDGEIDTGYKDSSRYELVIRQFGSESR